MLVIHLNLTIWLFGTKLANIMISFMHAVGQNIWDIILYELIQPGTFIQMAIFTNLSMQSSKDRVMLPTLKYGSDNDIENHASLPTCMPHACNHGFQSLVCGQ